MKFLTLILTLGFSLNLLASDKCYNQARIAAVNFAISEDFITSAKDFTSEFDSEVSEVSENNGTWQKEFHSFYNNSYGINVEVDFAKGKCFVKEVSFFQNDQDQD